MRNRSLIETPESDLSRLSTETLRGENQTDRDLLPSSDCPRAKVNSHASTRHCEELLFEVSSLTAEVYTQQHRLQTM